MAAYPDAVAWVFGGKDCPGCNFLKQDLLPKLFDKLGETNAKVVTVDLDITENFSLLLDLEEKLASKGGAPPVLYWKNKLYYGTAAARAEIERE